MKRICVLLTALLLGLSARADTSVWKVESANGILYLGGTCHVLREKDYPLPPEYDAAYAKASIVVFETDIAKATSPEMNVKLMRGCMYTDGKTTLKTVLSPAVYKKLEAYCATVNLQLDQMKQFRPPIVLVSLTFMELGKHGIAMQGVDAHYYERAETDNKRVDSLDTLEQQIAFIAGMGEGNEDAFVLHSLEDLGKVGERIGPLLAAWRSGDTARLENLFLKDFRKDFPKVYEQLIVKRNRAWLPRIEHYLETADTEVVLVGAAHIVGKDGLLAALKKKGYKVTRLSAPAPKPVAAGKP